MRSRYNQGHERGRSRLIWLLASFLGTTESKAQGQEVQIQPSTEDAATKAELEDDPRSLPESRGTILSEWSPSRVRWFVAARADIGYLFFRPRLSVGYGRPHNFWAGLDVVPILGSRLAGLYSGLKFQHPRVEVRSGVLFGWGFNSSYLEPQNSYTADDISRRSAEGLEYRASDSELTLSAPLAGWGFLSSETQGIVLMGTPENRDLFVETLGVVMHGSYAIRQRFSYGIGIPSVPGLSVGPAVEGVVDPARAEPWVLRAGLLLRWSLYQDLELRTDVLPTIKSPDTLGRAGSPWLTINVRLLWSTD